MTTTVIVSLPKPNHQRALVEAVSPSGDIVYQSAKLEHGESTVMYVHSGQSIRVTEIE